MSPTKLGLSQEFSVVPRVCSTEMSFFFFSQASSSFLSLAGIDLCSRLPPTEPADKTLVLNLFNPVLSDGSHIIKWGPDFNVSGV